MSAKKSIFCLETYIWGMRTNTKSPTYASTAYISSVPPNEYQIETDNWIDREAQKLSRKSGGKWEALDLAQEVRTQVLKDLKKQGSDEIENLEAWCRSVVRRKMRRLVFGEVILDPETGEPIQKVELVQLTEEVGTDDLDLEGLAGREAILGVLNPEERKIALLREMGYSDEQIANQLDLKRRQIGRIRFNSQPKVRRSVPGCVPIWLAAFLPAVIFAADLFLWIIEEIMKHH